MYEPVEPMGNSAKVLLATGYDAARKNKSPAYAGLLESIKLIANYLAIVTWVAIPLPVLVRIRYI